MVTKEEIIEICKSIEDPEINVDIWTLGLIYEIRIEKKKVYIKMTFTSMMCPFGPEMVEELKSRIKEKGFDSEIEVVFDPPWQPSEELREMLGV